MRIQTQRKLANAASLLLALTGVSAIAWVLFSPIVFDVAESDQSNVRRRGTGSIPEIDLGALNKNLQGPLVPADKKKREPVPVPIETTPTPIAKPVVRWPKLSLDSIIAGKNNKVAVLSVGQESIVCQQGDEFQNISVVEIATTSVELVFAGETRTLRANTSPEKIGAK